MSKILPKYIDIESAMLILDFTDCTPADIPALMEKKVFSNALSGLRELGVCAITFNAKEWAFVEGVLEEIKDILDIKLICRVSIDKIPTSGISPAVPVQISLEIPEIINTEAEVQKYLQKLGELKKHLTGENYRIVSVVLPINRDNVLNASKIAHLLYKETGYSIVLSPDVNVTLDEPDKITWQQLDLLYCQIIDIMRSESKNDALLMDLGILPTRLLTEHPCNGYVCSGTTCHSDKSNLPRRLAILPDGTVLPENRFTDERLIIGNVQERTLRDILQNEYFEKEKHREFLAVAREIYVNWVQTCPFRVVPWGKLLVETSKKQ